MTRFRAVLVVSVLSIATLLSTKMARAESIGFSISDQASSTTSDGLSVRVLDDFTQAPIPGANVSITDSLQFGHPTDRMRTDQDGITEFRNLAPVPKTVTVTKPGYATLSVVGVEGQMMTAYLRPYTESPKTVVSSGTMNRWDDLGTDDGILHGGMVLRTVSAVDLLHFNIDNFISPLKDEIDFGGIFGKHSIPSNLVAPEQTISYFIFSIDLNKPLYRLPIPASQKVGLTGVEFEAKVGDLVSASHDTPAQIVNKIHFKRIGVSQGFSAVRDVQVNLDASLPLSPHHTVSISQLPPFKADVLAVSFIDELGDKRILVPTDAKGILSTRELARGPQQVTLGSPDSIPAEHRAVATVAVTKKGEQVSGILVDSAGSSVQTGAFLNTDLLPQNQPLPASVRVQAPAQGIAAAIFETTQPVWYVYTLPVAGSVTVPTAKISASGLKLQTYAVNQVEFSQFDPQAVDGTKIMSRLQRFARSSAIIK